MELDTLVVWLFSCLVDCIVYTFNKITKQQNHNIKH